jgi:hypothetical protein
MVRKRKSSRMSSCERLRALTFPSGRLARPAGAGESHARTRGLGSRTARPARRCRHATNSSEGGSAAALLMPAGPKRGHVP